MAITDANSIEKVAKLLSEFEWMDQETACKALPLADAAMEALTVLIYQAGTGRATRQLFSNARKDVRRALERPQG